MLPVVPCAFPFFGEVPALASGVAGVVGARVGIVSVTGVEGVTDVCGCADIVSIGGCAVIVVSVVGRIGAGTLSETRDASPTDAGNGIELTELSGMDGVLSS